MLRVALQPLHGWIALDKPYGLGSTEAVTRVKRLLKPQKIGHGGTLDPLATGILPIALGEATKTVSFMMDAKKIYQFVIQFGSETTTLDVEGEVVAMSPVRPSLEQIEVVLPEFVGVQMQMPPVFSALKINGKRACDLARAGRDVTLAARPIMIHTLSVVRMESESAVLCEVCCGKGTYVRSLARDIARRLGTVGHVTYLRREAVGVLNNKVKISLEKLEELVHIRQSADNDVVGDWLSHVLLPLDGVLDDIPAIELESEQAKRLVFGQKLFMANLPEDVRVYKARCEGKLVAMVSHEAGVLSVLRGFNL